MLAENIYIKDRFKIFDVIYDINLFVSNRITQVFDNSG